MSVSSDWLRNCFLKRPGPCSGSCSLICLYERSRCSCLLTELLHVLPSSMSQTITRRGLCQDFCTCLCFVACGLLQWPAGRVSKLHGRPATLNAAARLVLGLASSAGVYHLCRTATCNYKLHVTCNAACRRKHKVHGQLLHTSFGSRQQSTTALSQSTTA